MRACLIAAAIAVGAAMPSHGSELHVYTHNGSVVHLVLAGTAFRAVYAQPRSGLERIGIRPNTLLATGRVGRGRVRGQAFTFRAGCPPAPYDVSGTLAIGSRVVLRGAAPTWGSGCDITGYSARSPHARLVFDYVRTPPLEGDD